MANSSSTTITLRGVPASLHARLKRRAESHRRSLNSEVLHLIETSLEHENVDREALAERIRRRRRDAPAFSHDPDEVKRVMREGLAAFPDRAVRPGDFAV